MAKIRIRLRWDDPGVGADSQSLTVPESVTFGQLVLEIQKRTSRQIVGRGG